MAEEGPFAGRHPSLQVALNFFRRGMAGQTEALGKPRHMRIHDDSNADTKGVAQNNVCGLAAHPGQFDQLLHCPWDKAAVLLDKRPTCGLYVFRLVAIKADASYGCLKFGAGREGKIGGRPIFLEKVRRDTIDLAIAALGGEHCGDKQFERIGIREFAMRIGVRRLESGDDPQNALLCALKGFAGHIRLLRINAMPSAAKYFGVRARL
jgi:hypothetical protein